MSILKKVFLKIYSLVLKMYKFLLNLILKIVSKIYQKIFLILSSTNLDYYVMKNRTTLKNIDSFVDLDYYQKSPDFYGLPKYILKHIDKELNLYPSYSDFLIFLIDNFKNKNNFIYVEIGVSVLKNFYLISSHLNYSKLYAFDINEVNPAIEKKFKFLSSSDNLSRYKFNSNEINYYKGDVFNSAQLDEFKKIVNKAHIIFSDAHHSYDGLINEYKYLISTMLSDEFLIYYDDLKGNLNKAFLEISKDLSNKFDIKSYTFLINGWVGNNEKMHKNGIITNLNFEEIIKTNKIHLLNLKSISF